MKNTARTLLILLLIMAFSFTSAFAEAAVMSDPAEADPSQTSEEITDVEDIQTEGSESVETEPSEEITQEESEEPADLAEEAESTEDPETTPFVSETGESIDNGSDSSEETKPVQVGPALSLFDFAGTRSGLADKQFSKTKLPSGMSISKMHQSYAHKDSIYLVWTRKGNVKGYYLYRKVGLNGKWKLYKTFTNPNLVVYYDKSVRNGTVYAYKVIAFKKKKKAPSILKNDMTGAHQMAMLKPVKLKAFKKKTSKTILVKWTRNSAADGYVVQYSKNNVFQGKNGETTGTSDPVIITSNKKLSTVIKGKREKTWARVYAYKMVNGYPSLSDWSPNGNIYRNIVITVRKKDYITNSKGKKIDIRSACGQKMWNFDTTQGAVYDGKRYLYMNLDNRYLGANKIVKMDCSTSTHKFVKASKIIRGCHGNDITYNPDDKCLYVSYSKLNKKYIGKVRASDLKFIKKVPIKIPRKLYGASGKTLKDINCFNEIHYEPTTKQYLLKVKDSHAMLILDKNFKPILYRDTNHKVVTTNQNMQGNKDFYLRVQSDYQSVIHNYLTIFDWHGKFYSKVYIKVSGELENIYFIGDQMWGHVYKKDKEKVPVGQVVVLDKVKKNGKWVFKKKKVKKKNSYKQLVRRSYGFHIRQF